MSVYVQETKRFVCWLKMSFQWGFFFDKKDFHKKMSLKNLRKC